MAVSLATGIVGMIPASGFVAPKHSGVNLFGAWIELTAATPATWYIGASVVSVQGSADVEIGSGGSGDEVVIGSIRTRGQVAGQLYWSPLPIPIGPIAAGTRLSVRTNNGTNTGNACSVAVSYYQGYTPGTSDNAVSVSQPISSFPPQASPLTASYVVAANSGTGVAWQNNAWTEMTSGVTDPMAIYGIARAERNGSATDYEWEIGTGGSGAETVVATLRVWGGGSSRDVLYLPTPYYVQANTRVAIRSRRSVTTSFTFDHTAALLVYRSFNNVTQFGSDATSIDCPLDFRGVGYSDVSADPAVAHNHPKSNYPSDGGRR